MAWTLALAYFLVGWWGTTTDNSRATNKPGLSMLLPHFDSDKLLFLVRLMGVIGGHIPRSGRDATLFWSGIPSLVKARVCLINPVRGKGWPKRESWSL